MRFKRALFFALIISGIVGFSGCWSSTSKKQSSKNDKWETYSASPKPENNSDKKDDDSDGDMNESDKNIKSGGFKANLSDKFQIPSDAVGRKMLKEYGAMFVAKNGALPPEKVVFDSESEVSAWQSAVAKSSETINGTAIELQTPAMNALKDAIREAQQSGQSISPRGSDAARRDYSGTVSLWASRVNPGLDHWVSKGRLQKSDADRIRALPVVSQIAEIFRLEEQGMYFAKSLDKSIIYSVAPPGTSQHISMLALDVNEHENPKVRQILADHGWVQTVISDLPHFTYLGAKESELSALGLKKVSDGGRTYWIPNL